MSGETILMDSQKVRDAVMELRTSVTAVSRKTGLSYPTIWNILKNDKRVRTYNAMRIADALGLPVESLVKGGDVG